MRTKFKAWAEPYIKEHQEVSFPLEKVKELKDIYLEIGSGKGEFLTEMAKKNLDKTFIGIEKNVTCSGFVAKHLVEEKIENAKLIWADAANVIPELKDESVKVIFLNFSDPWPKKRHHKRRLTSNNFLNEYYRILSKGGRLIFKTDNIDLFNDSLEYFESSEFTLISKTNDYKGDDEFDAMTEYQRHFIEEGTAINRVIYQK